MVNNAFRKEWRWLRWRT